MLTERQRKRGQYDVEFWAGLCPSSALHSSWQDVSLSKECSAKAFSDKPMNMENTAIKVMVETTFKKICSM